MIKGGLVSEGAVISCYRSNCLPATVLPAAATAAVTAESTTTTAACTIFLRPGFVDIESPAIHITAVKTGDGFQSLAVVAHFHESEAARPAGVAVGNDVYPVNGAILLKHSSDGTFGGVEAEISNKNIFHLVFFLKFAERRTRAG